MDADPADKKIVARVGTERVFAEFVPPEEEETWKAKMLPPDCRVQEIRCVNGTRMREWREAVDESTTVSFSDWPLKGPRTAEWCLRFLLHQPGGRGGAPRLVAASDKPPLAGLRVAEHEQILEVVRQAVTYDQFSIVNSAAFEVLLRRAQMIEYAHAERLEEHGSKGSGKAGGFLSLEEQKSFYGTMRTGVLMVSPDLVEHV